MNDKDTYQIHEETSPAIDFRKNERELVLSKLMEAIEFLHKKSMKGQIRKPETDRVKIGYFKALCHACSVYNQISRDSELDELKIDVEKLKLHIK